MSDEWPKSWDTIMKRNDGYGDNSSIWNATPVVEMGPIKAVDGTVYINAKGGVETDDNPDQWLPLERYLQKES